MNKYIQALTLVPTCLGVASLPSIWLYMEFGIWFVIDELFIGLYAMHLGTIAILTVLSVLVARLLSTNE